MLYYEVENMCLSGKISKMKDINLKKNVLIIQLSLHITLRSNSFNITFIFTFTSTELY